MTSDAAVTSPETADAQPRQEVLSALPPMPQPPRLVMCPEALEA
jgi:hypothetical protein